MVSAPCSSAGRRTGHSYPIVPYVIVKIQLGINCHKRVHLSTFYIMIIYPTQELSPPGALPFPASPGGKQRFPGRTAFRREAGAAHRGNIDANGHARHPEQGKATVWGCTLQRRSLHLAT